MTPCFGLASFVQQHPKYVLSLPPHDSPYRDAPVSNSASTLTSSDRPDRNGSSSRRDRADHNGRNGHAGRSDRRPASRKPAPSRSARPAVVSVAKPTRTAHDSSAVPTKPRSRSRRRRGSGSGAVQTTLTSVPTSRNAYVETRAWLLAEHGPVCAYCGVKFAASVMTLDHVAPRRGLTAYDRRDNLVLACPGCNATKADKAPLAFLLASRARAINMVKYGSHLSPMLLDLAQSLVPAGAQVPEVATSQWAWDLDDGESPYRD